MGSACIKSELCNVDKLNILPEMFDNDILIIVTGQHAGYLSMQPEKTSRIIIAIYSDDMRILHEITTVSAYDLYKRGARGYRYKNVTLYRTPPSYKLVIRVDAPKDKPTLKQAHNGFA